jgi:hypothetical protein
LLISSSFSSEYITKPSRNLWSFSSCVLAAAMSSANSKIEKREKELEMHRHRLIQYSVDGAELNVT